MKKSQRGLSPKGTVPLRNSQRGYLLITVVVTLFLIASIAMLINYDSAIDANTSSKELETARVNYVAEAAMQHAMWRTQNNACMGNVTIPDTAIGPDSYTASITGAGSSTMYSLNADQDAWIRSDDVTNNNGTNADQHIRFESGNIEQALTRFDLSSLPANAQINSATAWFYVASSGPGGGAHPEGPLTVHRVTADWSETDATWDTMNGNFDTSVLATISAQADDDVWTKINLTAQVQAWVNGQPNFGILMASAAEGVHGKYVSREGAASEQPYIEIVVGSGPASPVSVQATGTLANGVSRLLSRPATAAYQPSVVQTLSPGPSESEDAEIWDQAPTNNYGDAAETWVSSASSDTTRSLLRFNVDVIPAGARILEATLSMQRQSGSAAPEPVTAHRITNSWSEGSVTWNLRETGTNWDTAGGDFEYQPIATTLVGAPNQRYEWDVSTLVQGWVDGSYPNDGVVLVAGIDGMTGERFYTSDTADATQRPGLTITYACECGTACMAPQGSGNILMVVLSPTVLVAEEQQAKDLFESWGYTVSVIGESANQNGYDASMAANDVVFISETVNSNSVGSRLDGATIGVISQDGDYNPDVGLATGSVLEVGSDIDVTSTDHYITRPFQLGPLPIYTAGMEQLVTSGALTAGQQTLADIDGDSSLVVLEQGDALEGGGSAPGRRVILPLGTRYRFDWNRLNANGRLMVQRALAWGMGEGDGSSNTVLMVVANAGSPSTSDIDKKTLIESWGYAVTLIDDGDSQANFDAALAASDVAYIAEGSNPGTIGGKLTGTIVGIVNEQKALLIELGFSGEVDSNSRSDIVILDNTHSITSGLALGTTTITTSNQPFTFTNNGSAPGAQVLAETNQVSSFFEPSLLTLETNAELWGGGSAAGRRVALPWGDIGFDVNALNADGLMIMQRAFEWAAMPPGAVETKNVLFVVGSVGGAGLTTEELAHQTIIEAWGYTVEVIDDGASEADFNVAVANNDVVFMTNDITASSVGTKLVDAAIGVVTSEDNLSDEFGMSSGIAWESGTVLEVNDNTHYITAPFSLAPLTYSSANESLAYVTGTLSADLKQLASSSSGYGVVALDAGASMFGGGSTAGRRVQLPWGGNGFDPNNLSADGLTILLRALEWGAGAGESAAGPLAHWKFDDGTGTTAIDSEGGHDGTLTNGPNWIAGQVGDALDFDGVDDAVIVPHSNSLALTQEMTFTAWVNSNEFGASGPYDLVISKGNVATVYDYYFGTLGDEIIFGFSAGGTYQEFTTSGFNLPTGVWHHIAATFDNSTDTVKLYHDGAEVLSATTTYDPPTNSRDLYIGSSEDGADWDGMLDDVRIYDRVLDFSEIAAIAAEGGGGGGAGGGGSCDGTFRDEFNTQSYSNNDGSLSWSTDWLEINENNGWDSGDERVDDNDSDFHLQVRDNDGGGEGVQREADLSANTAATFSFEYRRDGFDNENDYVMVHVSDNGGISWAELDRFTGPGTDSSYVPKSYDISAYISSNTRIRFLTSPDHGSGDEMYIDNVEIASSGCANP